MEELVTIIVPMYNSENYIENCLNSLIEQTYKNIEIIVVDDGSKDNGLSICQKFCQQDSRIKVIHKENGGVSSARNVGLDNAKGKYICFVDSDDQIMANMIQQLIYNMQKFHLKLTCCGMCYKGINFGDGKSIVGRKEEIVDFADKEKLCDYLFDDNIGIYYVTNKMFDRECIGDLRFKTGVNFGEDMIFAINYLSKIDKFYYINQPLYIYNRQNSVLSKIFKNNYLENGLKIFNNIYDFYYQTGNEKIINNFYEDVVSYIFSSIYYGIQIKGKKEYKELFNKAKENIVVSQAVNNFKPRGVKQKLKLYCVKHSKFNFAIFLMKFNKFFKK